MRMGLNLRDHLLAALATLPGTREFHIHVLVSSPRKNSSLFQFAKPRPRVYLQDILVLLSEQANPDAPRILVTAIEAALYNIPITSCAVLYVSKVDSTGQSTGRSPTATLVRSLLNYYADPTTSPIAIDHLWIQLFARAQAQYLFANSAEYSEKRPLSDVRLCAWWKRLLSEVARNMDSKKDSKTTVRAYYILPGYNELEADNSLGFVSRSTESTSFPWVYGHPYSPSGIHFPCPTDSNEEIKNLGHYIPYFDDDPKSRFLDEIAYTTEGEGVKSPARKRSRTMSQGDPKVASEEKKTQNGKDDRDRPLGELGKVTQDEFWERMSFRQECVAGAATGFFTLAISNQSPHGRDSDRIATPSPLAPQPGQISSQINKRIMTSLLTGVEFSTFERAIRATETIEGAIKGLCEGIAPVPTVGASSSQRDFSRRTPSPEPSTRSALLAPPSTPPRRTAHGKHALPEVSPNPFPEPVASLETYHSHIYGSICVSNALREPDRNTSAGKQETDSAPHVTVLTVRKKKKRTEL